MLISASTVAVKVAYVLSVGQRLKLFEERKGTETETSTSLEATSAPILSLCSLPLLDDILKLKTEENGNEGNAPFFPLYVLPTCLNRSSCRYPYMLRVLSVSLSKLSGRTASCF